MAKQLLYLDDVDVAAKNTGEVTSFRDSVMVIGAENDEDAKEYLIATSASSQYGLMRGDVTLKRSYGPDTFHFGIDYKEKDVENPQNLPGTKISFDTGGSSKHITEAIDTKKYGGTGINLGNKIKVDSDGNVQGIDIPSSFLRFSETRYFKRSSLSFAYLQKLKSLTNCVNSEPFRGFEAGEVRFAGASGNWDEDTNIIAVVFNYEAKENEAATTIEGIECEALSGWVYRWIYYKPKLDTDELTPKAAAIFDNLVFHVDDLNKLGSI